MGKKNCKLVFIVPFYDNDISQLHDAIESIEYYVKEPHFIVCVNDCKKDQNLKMFENANGKINFSNVINFIPKYDAHWPKNTYGPLFCKKYQAIEFTINNFEFDYLICLDTDALVTGFHLYDYLMKYYDNENTDIGMLGSYKMRADGMKRTRWQWALIILYLFYIKRKIGRKSLFWNVWVPLARENGYKLGNHVLGGAFICSYDFIKSMTAQYPYDLILREKLYSLDIGDDVIFSLLVFACNFKIADFGRPNDPLAIAQNYLPISKEEINKQEKQIVHSLKRGWNGESEEELRKYFRGLRNKIGGITS